MCLSNSSEKGGVSASDTCLLPLSFSLPAKVLLLVFLISMVWAATRKLLKHARCSPQFAFCLAVAAASLLSCVGAVQQQRFLLPDPTKPENRETCFPQGLAEEHRSWRARHGEGPKGFALREGAVLCDVDGELSREEFLSLTRVLSLSNSDKNAPKTCGGSGEQHQYAVALLGHGHGAGSQEHVRSGMARYWRGLDDEKADQALALLDEYGDGADQVKNELARSFASRVHKEWGVGQSSCHNGILFFISLGRVSLSIALHSVKSKTDSRTQTIGEPSSLPAGTRRR